MPAPGIHPADLRRLVSEVLHALDLYSEAALALLLGTAAQESGCGRRLYQLAGGPARGIYQMEPATEDDIWTNYLRYRPRLRAKITKLTGHSGPGPWLAWDLAYQTAMARVHYLRVPAYLPDPHDLDAQAHYYKIYYNTPAGKAQPADYIRHARQYLA